MVTQPQSSFLPSGVFLFIMFYTGLLTVGDRAFPVAAARVWNSLPDLVTSAPSVAVFRSRLKLTCLTFPTPVIVHCLRSDSTLCPPKKTCDYIFYNNFNSKCPITIIFGIVSSKSMRHQMMVSFPTSPI